MDKIWKEGGMDCKMTLYQCLPTTTQEGLIEVVQDAETLCKIQIQVVNLQKAATYSCLSCLQGRSEDFKRGGGRDFENCCVQRNATRPEG